MLIVETIRKIRCAYHRDRKSIRQIAREFKLSRNTVKKVIRSDATEFTYDRKAQPLPKLAPYQELLSELSRSRRHKATQGAADGYRAV